MLRLREDTKMATIIGWFTSEFVRSDDFEYQYFLKVFFDLQIRIKISCRMVFKIICVYIKGIVDMLKKKSIYDIPQYFFVSAWALLSWFGALTFRS